MQTYLQRKRKKYFVIKIREIVVIGMLHLIEFVGKVRGIKAV
jgi:hypothetical protein